MKVLVTGGLGYLGSVLRSELATKGIQTRIIDSDFYGRFSKEGGVGAEFVRADVRDTRLVSKYLDDVDAVVHLAAIVGDAAGDINREMTIQINSASTARLAAECAKRRIRMIFASTSSVYGYNGSGLLAEDAKTVPLSVYAICKLVAEKAISKEIPDDSVVFRLGTLFGLSPRMRFDLVVNRFIAQAIQDGKITVFGGDQVRPFLHVSTAAKLISKALLTKKVGLYNLGGTNLTIKDVADTISKLSNCEVRVYEEIHDQRNYAIDSRKAEAVFGSIEGPGVEFAFSEISGAYQRGQIIDYGDKRYNNEEFLRKLG